MKIRILTLLWLKSICVNSQSESVTLPQNSYKGVSYEASVLPLQPITHKEVNVTRPFNASSHKKGKKIQVSFSVDDSIKNVKLRLLCIKDSAVHEVDEIEEISISQPLEASSSTITQTYYYTLPTILACGYGPYYFVQISAKIPSSNSERVYSYSPFPHGFFSIVEPDSNLWWLFGVFLSIIASIASNLGVNFQKLSMMNERASAKASEKRSYITQPMWLMGLLMVVVGSLGDFVALGFAPQSLMTPVGGFTLVCNAVFAHYFLKEHLTRKDRIGTLNIIIGIIILAIFSSKDNTSYTLSRLLRMYIQRGFIIYGIALLIIILNIYRWYLKCVDIEKKHGRNHKNYEPWKKIHPFSCSALSGMLGAQSVLCAKCVAEMFKESARIGGEMQFDKPLSWLIVFAMIFFIFSQIHWLARGLESFDAVYIVPVFQCFFITVSVIGGAVYFREFDNMEPTNVFMFYVGLGVTLSGVYLLSQREMTLIKPIQRFRARVYVVIFIIRTKKVIENRNAELRQKMAIVDGNNNNNEKKNGEAHPGDGVELDTVPPLLLPGSINDQKNPNGGPLRGRTRTNSEEGSIQRQVTPLEGHIAISPMVHDEVEAQKSEVRRTKNMLKRRGSAAAVSGLPQILIANKVEENREKIQDKVKEKVIEGTAKVVEKVRKISDRANPNKVAPEPDNIDARGQL